MRKYDAFGYKAFEAELATPDFLAVAQSARRNIGRLGDERFTLGAVINPGFTATVSAVAQSLGKECLPRDEQRRGTELLYYCRGRVLSPGAALPPAGGDALETGSSITCLAHSRNRVGQAPARLPPAEFAWRKLSGRRLTYFETSSS